MDQQTNSQCGTLTNSTSCQRLAGFLVAGLVQLFGVDCLAQQARWILPPGAEARLEIQNMNRESVDIYTKEFAAAGGPREVSIQLPAGQMMTVDLKTTMQLTLIESINELLKVKWTEHKNQSSQYLPVGQSNHLHFPAAASLQEGELIVTNLSSQSQDGRILTRKSDSAETIFAPFRLKGREVLSLGRFGLPGTAFSIQAPFNMMAYYKTLRRTHFAELRKNQNPLPAPQGRYFVLGNSKKSVGYLVDLVDPAMIDAARLQIKDPENFQSRILLAEISVNQNLENRNWYDKLQSPWSWRIEKPLRFASLASQACDGHPQMVEDHLEAWLNGAHSGGRPIICFWGYQVLEELP